MSRIVKTVEVTVTVEFDYADEEAGEIIMAVPNAFDAFNASQDMVTLSWEGENLTDRVEIDSAERCTCAGCECCCEIHSRFDQED